MDLNFTASTDMNTTGGALLCVSGMHLLGGSAGIRSAVRALRRSTLMSICSLRKMHLHATRPTNITLQKLSGNVCLINKGGVVKNSRWSPPGGADRCGVH